MAATIALTGYDLSDDGPVRRFNEDVTLVREDLGLFVVADGAGGKGKGDVAATLAVRTIENYVGATVRKTHDRPDYDRLGNPEQARRLSRAVHQAHKNLLDAQAAAPERAGMATTVVAALLAPRTGHLHIAHVGDSRCYRLRHGRLELLTEDHTLASDILERRPDVPDEVLERLPKNSVVRALGMPIELRVSVRSVLLLPGDRFLLCSDGLTGVLHFDKIWRLAKEPDPASVLASELLSHALQAGAEDNVSLVVVDCEEQIIDDELPTRPYNQIPVPSRPQVFPYELANRDAEPPPSARLEMGAEIVTDEELEALADWVESSEAPTLFEERSGIDVTRELLERPAIEIPRHPGSERAEMWDDDPPPSYQLVDDEIELEAPSSSEDDAPREAPTHVRPNERVPARHAAETLDDEDGPEFP